MSAPLSPPSILETSDCEPDRVLLVLKEALSGADDGELFLERSESESFVFDDGRLKAANYDAAEGFGLRVVAGETAGYAHASEISEAAIGRAAGSPSRTRSLFSRRSTPSPGPATPGSCKSPPPSPGSGA